MHPDEDSATTEYLRRRQNTEAKASAQDLDLFDDAYVFAGSSGLEVHFRENNLIGQMLLFTKPPYRGTIDTAEDWAKQLSDKISKHRDSKQPVHQAQSLNISASDLPQGWSLMREQPDFTGQKHTLSARAGNTILYSLISITDDEIAVELAYEQGIEQRLQFRTRGITVQQLPVPTWNGDEATLILVDQTGAPTVGEYFFGRRGNILATITLTRPREERSLILDIIQLLSTNLAE